jgi:hypothetical protein
LPQSNSFVGAGDGGSVFLFHATLIVGDMIVRLAKFFTQAFSISAFVLTATAFLAINTADAQQRRLDRNPNRTNVQCDIDGFDTRSNRGIENTLDEVSYYCRAGDTIILGSPVLVARLCDFSWAIASTGNGAFICVYGGVREVR